MTNYKIINSNEEPLFTDSTPSYIYGADQGQVYDITTGGINVAANGFLLFQLTNTSNSGKTINIIRLAGGSTVNTTLDIMRNAAFASSGIGITPHNNNWDYSDTSVCSAKYLTSGSDVTSGGSLLISYIQTGGQTLFPFDGRLVIPSSTSDRQFYIRLTNNTNQVNRCSLSLAYWEK